MTTLLDTTPSTTMTLGGQALLIALPAGADLINSNQRHHHYAKAKLTAEIRAAAHKQVTEHQGIMAALKAAKPGPLFQRAHVLGILRPATARRADPANWYPSFKAALDGLVDAGLLEDDDHEHVAGPDMRLGAKTPGGQIVLYVRPLAAGEDPLSVVGVAA